MTRDPRKTLADAKMHRVQIIVVALCIAMNALDGYDVLAISLAAPGIAADWGIDRATLGVVLSMELIGMAIGSVLIGNIADRVGRRPTILSCLVIMAIGMLAAATADNIKMLSVWRVLTGLGIGGMISTTSALVAEYSNDRRRSLNVSLNIAGYSTGAILGGLIAAEFLENNGDWHSVFLFGGVMTALALPLAWFMLPESIDSLIERKPPDALARINSILKKLGHEEIDSLPPSAPDAVKPSIASLFSSKHIRVTVPLAVAYFTQIMLFYYVLKWIPKIIVDMGYEAADGARVLVCANIGNLLGAVLIGAATQRFSLKPLIGGAMIAGFIGISLFGLGVDNLLYLSAAAAVAAFFINAGVVGLYPIMARVYPARLRASGTGFVIGTGRGGSAIGPVIAGTMFAGGAGLFLVSATMGAGALIAAAMVFILPKDRSDATGDSPAGES